MVSEETSATEPQSEIQDEGKGSRPTQPCSWGRLNIWCHNTEKVKAISTAVSSLERERKGCLSWVTPWDVESSLAGGSANGCL